MKVASALNTNDVEEVAKRTVELIEFVKIEGAKKYLEGVLVNKVIIMVMKIGLENFVHAY